MKCVKMLLCLLILCLVGGSEKEAESQKISLERRLPSAVAICTPRGAKSYFWGTIHLPHNNSLYGIHLFKRDPYQGQTNTTVGQKFTLDVFSIEQGICTRINRIPVNYTTQIWAPTLVDARVLWLDKYHSKPLLKLRIYTPDGFVGPIGDEVAVTFPEGFTQPASVQSWNWGASNTNGYENIWSTRDIQGVLRVVSNEFVMFGQSQTMWVWQKNRFVIEKSTYIPG